ncbi:MAG: hypothetical protein H6713_24350 [Myxococcales bacterium]|nr:hypothetical protein [Myxococcales bacterium]
MRTLSSIHPIALALLLFTGCSEEALTPAAEPTRCLDERLDGAPLDDASLADRPVAALLTISEFWYEPLVDSLLDQTPTISGELDVDN